MKNPIKKVKTLNDQLLIIIIKIENIQNRNEIESKSRNGCGSRSGNYTWRGEEEEESEEENPKVLHRQHWEILGKSWYWCAFLFFDFNFVSCGKWGTKREIERVKRVFRDQEQFFSWVKLLQTLHTAYLLTFTNKPGGNFFLSEATTTGQ